MTNAEAIAAVRASSRHDEDEQVNDTDIAVRLDSEYRRLRRLLATPGNAPELYATASSHVVDTGLSGFAKPTDFDTFVKLERLATGTLYYPVQMAYPDALNVGASVLTAFERGGTFQLRPESSAPGTYRLTYVAAPAAGYTSLDLPAGLEEVVTERVAAWVRMRHDEETGPHDKLATRILAEQLPALRRRFGVHPRAGLVVTRV